MDKVTEINLKIKELEDERQKVLAEETNISEKDFCKLEWTKDFDAVLHIDWSLGGYEFARYKLKISGKKYPSMLTGRLPVLGQTERNLSKNNNNCVFYEYLFGDLQASFTTSSKELLLELIDKAKFKSVSIYDKVEYDFLNKFLEKCQ